MISLSFAERVPWQIFRFSISSGVSSGSVLPSSFQVLPAMVRIRSIISSDIRSLPRLASDRKRNSSRRMGSMPPSLSVAADPQSASLFDLPNPACNPHNSKRSRRSPIRSKMVSSFVALSTTHSGVVTFPTSWSHAAVCNSFI